MSLIAAEMRRSAVPWREPLQPSPPPTRPSRVLSIPLCRRAIRPSLQQGVYDYYPQKDQHGQGRSHFSDERHETEGRCHHRATRNRNQIPAAQCQGCIDDRCVKESKDIAGNSNGDDRRGQRHGESSACECERDPHCAEPGTKPVWQSQQKESDWGRRRPITHPECSLRDGAQIPSTMSVPL
jgi:hypothetical protein